MIDEVVAIVLGVVPVVLGIVTVAVGDATQYWCLRIGFIGNARGLVGVSGAVGRSIASEDAIRSGISASYANPKPQRLRLGLAKMVSPSK